MALTRPILLPVTAFDANNEQVFQFNVIGGSQVVYNTLIIRNNDTNDIVYQERQETYKYEHTVNAGELQNGVAYNATLITYDKNLNASATSDAILFYCFTTPIISFTNLPSDGVIDNANFDVEFTYTQAENEPITSYQIALYEVTTENPEGVQVTISDVQYVEDGTPPFSADYLYAGFDNQSVYFIKITATTVYGTEIEAQSSNLTVEYATVDYYTSMLLTNKCQEGYIEVKSNIIIAEGVVVPSPAIYLEDSSGQPYALDVSASGASVTWSQGFDLSGDFLTRLWFANPTLNSAILTYSNSEGETITLYYREGYENVGDTTMKAYMDAVVQGVGQQNYYIYSNYVDILPAVAQGGQVTRWYNVWLNRRNNIYELQLAIH